METPVLGGANAISNDLGGSNNTRRQTPDGSVKSPPNYRIRSGILAALVQQMVDLLAADIRTGRKRMTTATKTEDGVSIPNWFLRVLGIVMAVTTFAFLPWSIWVTTRSFVAGDIAENVRQNTAKIREIEQNSFSTAAQLQVFSATRFTAEHGETLRKSIESRMDKIDNRVIDLQRDLDRRFGK